MGGSSGGGYFSRGVSPAELRKQVQQADAERQNDQYESDVAAMLDSYLADINKRDSASLSKHVQEITSALEKDIDGSVGLLFGGSVAKRTYVNGLSDVDVLVIVNRSDLIDKSPTEVQGYFLDRLKERFPNTSVKQGCMAVTVSFDDMEVQLLPAIHTKAGVRLPNPDTTGWSDIICPDRFASKLSKENQRCSGKLVPTIKLAKLILAKLPVEQQLSGYHVESLAIRVFGDYSGTYTTKAMLRYFFTEAPSHLRSPIGDITGQSFHVDDYLGPAKSLKRRIAADSVARIGRCIHNADSACSLDQWRDVLE